MNGRRASIVAWFSFAVSASFFCIALALMATTSLRDRGEQIPFVLVFLLWGLVGALIASRNPENGVGWLFCVFGFLGESTFAAEVYANRGTTDGLSRAHELAGWYETWAGDWIPPLVGTLLILVFPTGRLRTTLERFTAALGAAAFLAAAVASAVMPGPLPRQSFDNPLGIAGMKGPIAAAVDLGGAFVPLVFVLALTALVKRLRSSRGDERAQLKWFVFAAGVIALDLVLASAVTALGVKGGDQIGTILFLLGLAGLPVATGMAILKYRLYEIDLVINRTLVYISLTAILAGAYLGMVVLLQSAFGDLTRDSDLAVAASTLAVAAMFRPLRARVQAFIDRRFYRQKYDARSTLESFSSRLRDDVDLHHMTSDLAYVVRETMQPTHVSVWLRGTG